MKKIICFLASVCMIFSSAAPILAASETNETFYSPTIKFNSNRYVYSYMERFPNDIALRLSETEKASGKYSLFADTYKKGADSADVEQYLGNTKDASFSMPSNLAANTEYTFSVKIKIAEGGKLNLMRINQTGQPGQSADGVPPYYFINRMANEPLDSNDPDGWRIYTQTFNTLSNNGPYLHFVLGGAENVYIDDLYLKNNTENRVLLDYGFEDAQKVDMYNPSSVSAEAENYGELKLSWRNPMNKNVGWTVSNNQIKTSGREESGIINVSLYDVTENPDADVSALEPIFSVDRGSADNKFSDVNTEANEMSSCRISGLESETKYTYKLVIKTDRTKEDASVETNVSETLIEGTTLKTPPDWKPELKQRANFHHISPTGFMNDEKDPSVAIAFYNPKSTDIKSITLDRIENGEAKRIEGIDFNLDNNAVNYCEVNGLEKGTRYFFKLNCEFNDGTKESAAFDAIAGSMQRPSKINTWATYYSTGASENIPGIIRLDTTEKHSGNSSLYMSTSIAGSEGNRYCYLAYNGCAFKADTSYKLRFYAKGRNASNIRFYAGWANSKKMVGLSGLTEDWKLYELEFSNLTEKSNQMFFLTDGKCEDFWIDDLEVFEADDPEEKNMVTDGDFETDRTDKLPAVTDAAYKAQDGKVTLSWTNAMQALTSYVNVYEEFDDEKSFKGSYTQNEATIFELENDKAHKLAIVPVDSFGKEGEETKISVVPTAPSYSLQDVTFEKEGVKLSAVEAGEITAKVFAKNKSMGDDFKVTLIAALYDGFKMCGSVVSENTVVQAGDVRKELSVKINVPDDGKKYTLKLFMWDNRENKTILRSHESLEGPKTAE